jgi:hypothetical protein
MDTTVLLSKLSLSMTAKEAGKIIFSEAMLQGVVLTADEARKILLETWRELRTIARRGPAGPAVEFRLAA